MQPNLAPLRGAEKEEKGGRSASALLELEADKSEALPLKALPEAYERSEVKTAAAFLARRGSGEEGAALFAKKSDYINENISAESRRIERAENAESQSDSTQSSDFDLVDCHDSATQNLAMTVKGDSIESNENNSVIARKSAGLTKQSIKSCEATPHTCKSIEPTAEALPFNANDLSNFYPNSLLITSFDILFFWVARMLFSGESLLQKLPFKDIYLHALVCDEFGKKMSKSKGNVINPLELIESHSSDILRFCLAYNCIQGRDIRISQKSLTIGNALAVKLINALNFLLLYKNQQNASLNPHDSPARTQDSTNDFSHDSTKDSAMQNIREFSSLDAIKSPLGLYMYAKFNLCVKEVKTALDAYRFNDATNALYRFLFDDFCDFGIEAVKAQKEAVFELGGILRETMKLLHPFMPFISEFIWQNLNGTTLEDSSSIMIERFPTFDEKLSVNADFETIRDIITSIRRAKTNIDLANKSIALSFIKAKLSDETLALTFIPKLAKCEKVEFVEAKMEHCIFEMGERCEVYIPANELDLDMLIKKIEAKIAKTSKEKEKLESMLKNPNFIKNAPKNLIDSNQEALSEAQSRLAKLESELKSIKEI